MPTSLISNFVINTNSPIDSRMVVTSSAARDAILYKYDGMQVFTTDTRTMWTYNLSGNSWSDLSLKKGIYGGSGSLVGNTYIDTGSIGNFVGSQSYYFVLTASASKIVNFSTYFNRHTANDNWSGVELIQKFSNNYDSNYSYMSFNYSGYNDIGFGVNGSRKFSILSGCASSGNGIVIYSPTYSATISPSYLTSDRTYYLPNKIGTLALTTDVSFGNIVTNGNTSSNPIIIYNVISGVSYSNIISSNSISLYKGVTFTAGLDANGILKLADQRSSYAASIVSATLSANYTYSIPDGGGIFAMKKYTMYQKTNLFGITAGTTYSLFRVEGPSSSYGDFIITSIIQSNTTPAWASTWSSPYINIGLTYSSITSSSYNSFISGVNFSKQFNANIFDFTTLSSSYIYRPLSQNQEVVLLIATGSNVTGNPYTFDIYIEGFYTKL